MPVRKINKKRLIGIHDAFDRMSHDIWCMTWSRNAMTWIDIEDDDGEITQ